MAGSFIKPEISSLAVLFSLPFGIFFAWLLCVARFRAKLCSTAYCIYRWCTARGRRLLIISFDGTARVYRERLYDWFGITFAFSWRGAVSLPPSCRFR